MKTTTTGNDYKRFTPDAKGLDTAMPAKYYEFYTPKHIVEASIKVMGGIDLDPCSNSHKYPNVPSKYRYTKQDNGLAHMWKGTVYMNPPYGFSITAWIKKLVYHYETSDITEAIALFPASTGAKWFTKLQKYPCCFLHRRLYFLRPKGFSVTEARTSSVVFYFGKNTKRFCDVFGQLGGIYGCTHPYTPQR